MYVNLSALVRKMYSDTVNSSSRFNLLTITDRELNDYIALVASLKDVVIALDYIPDVHVEIVGDEPYVKHSLYDIP